jgi:monoamine oxidase
MNVAADVIVVGAGLSGLKAADVLTRAGKRVIVLEARDRIGGRVMKGELCGRVIDHGAQWVSPKQTRLLAEARRFGMETYLQYSDGRTILSLNGRRSEFVGDVPKMPVLAMIELAMLQRRWNKEMATLPEGAPWTAKNAKEWDCLTLEAWIGKNLSTQASRAFGRLIPKGSYGAHASEVSYLWMLEMLRGCGGLSHMMSVNGGITDAKFKGGAFGVAQHIADTIDGNITLSAPVEAVSQSDDHVQVKTAKGDYEAPFAVVAMPPGGCPRIHFVNCLSPDRVALQQRVPAGSIIKFHIAYREPFWRGKGYSGQIASDALPLGITMEDTQDTGPAMLIGFAEGAQARALSAMDADERRAAVMDCLAALFGDEARDVIGFAEKDWGADEWSRGYVGTMGPGVLTQYGEALRTPCGRIHWASSETALNWNGYMEGALESGERAANEVLARL